MESGKCKAGRKDAGLPHRAALYADNEKDPPRPQSGLRYLLYGRGDLLSFRAAFRGGAARVPPFYGTGNDPLLTFGTRRGVTV